MDWTLLISPKGSTSIPSKYTVSADSRYYAKIKSLIQYGLDTGSKKRPTQLLKDVDIQVKCHTDGRMVDYSKLED